MNIHIDKKTFDSLLKSTIFRVKIGSSMYGNTHKDSDTDYLNIYVESKEELQFFSRTHHQFQYKEDNIDHNFVSLESFIHNALNGDSTINFECLFSDELKNSELSFLYDMRNEFINYKIVKSYLGIARRDYRSLRLLKTNKEKYKKIGHIYRGLNFSIKILDTKFSPKLTEVELKEFDKINNLPTHVEMNKYCGELMEKVNLLRDNLNNEKDLNMINYMSPNSQKELFNHLSAIKSSEYYLSRLNESNNVMDYIFDANENGVNY
jgi:predicted nucleotidyltransferase